MTAARHKAAAETSLRRRLARLTAPALAVTAVTGAVVGVSVVGLDAAAPSKVAASQVAQPYVLDTTEHLDRVETLADREQRISRSARRITLEERPEPTGHRFATAPLNLRIEPSENADVLTVVDFATKLPITGEQKNGFAEVVWDGLPYWVSAEFLAKKKPKPEKEEKTSEASALPDPGNCTAAPPSGVTDAAMAVYEAVCAQFPTITTYGGYRPDGEHADGTSIDIMVSGELGYDVADYLLANASEFGLYDIIYSQRIWTADRSSEGWRPMEDRGSDTANHYDHVHVKVY